MEIYSLKFTITHAIDVIVTSMNHGREKMKETKITAVNVLLLQG
ncbi:hypothetical protein [Macrococcoides canis]|nr:hypothetical protein [Macrococcus canis]